MPINSAAKRWQLVALLIILAGCSGGTDTTRSLESYLVSAETYIDQGQYRPAMIELSNAEKIDPANPDLHLLRARVGVDLGNFRSAYRLLETIENRTYEHSRLLAEAYLLSNKYASAITLLRRDAALYEDHPVDEAVLTGRAYAGLNDREAAAKHIETALELNPDDPDAVLSSISLEAARGNLTTAESRLKEFLGENPGYVDALLMLNAVYIAQGRLEVAEASLTDTIGALPTTDVYTWKRAAVLRTLIALLARLGRSGEALVYQEALAEAFPQAEENRQQLDAALADIKAGSYEAGEAKLRELYENAPGNPTGGSLLGILSYLKGDDEAARQYFSESVDTETAPAPLLKTVAMNFYRLNRPQDVLETLERIVEETRDIQVLALYGVASIAAGKLEQGEEALLQAIDYEPENPRLPVLLAEHYKQLTPPALDKAEEVLRQSFEVNPSSMELQAGLVNVLIFDGQHEAAADFIRGRMRESPEDYETQVLAGDLWLRMEDPDAARRAYQAATAIDAGRPEAYLGLGYLERQESMFEDARAAYRKILEASPRSRQALEGLLASYTEAGMARQGIAALEELEEGNPTARLVISEHYIRSNQFADAERWIGRIEQSEAAAQADRLSAEMGLRRARQELQEGAYGDARESVFRALSIYPLNRLLLRTLAQVEIQSGQYGEAEKVIQMLRSNHPDSVFSTELEADLAAAQGELELAAELYRSVWQRIPDESVAARLIRLYSTLGNRASFQDFVNEWRERRPDSALATINLVELNGGDPAYGIDLYEEFLEENPRVPAILNNLAWLYLEQGEYDRGLKAARDAYQLAPANPSILDTYGWMLHKTADSARAEEILARALALAPDDEQIRAHLEEARGALNN